MKLVETLVIESIEPNLRSRNKEELFAEMAALLKKNPAMAEAQEATILRALRDREKTASTGVGKEVGIPHGKIMGLAGICGAIGVAKRGIEYDSVDGLPVRFVVALVAPPEESQSYLRVLAKVARLLSDPSFTETLVTARSAEDIFDAVKAMEAAPSTAAAGETKKLLIFELKDPDYFDAVIEYFTEVGAITATVFDARNIRGFLTKVPLFADFAKVFTEGQAFGHAFFLLIDEDAVEPFVKGLEDVIGDFEEEGRGLAFVLDVGFVRGAASRIEA